MGDWTCLMAFCPECERAVGTMEEGCPDCGSYVKWG